MPVAPAPSETELAERLAARTLELIDIPSESRSEAALAEYVASELRGAVVEDLGDSCMLAYPRETRPRVLLAGHLDTVPAQDNIPGRVEDGRVYGLGASDMKGALAVMMELVLARAPYAALFFPREELPSSESALTPLLERSPVDAEFVVVMEPTERRAARRLRRQHQRHVDVPRAAPGTRRGRGTPTTRSTARRPGSPRWPPPSRCRSRSASSRSPRWRR